VDNEIASATVAAMQGLSTKAACATCAPPATTSWDAMLDAAKERRERKEAAAAAAVVAASAGTAEAAATR
jgi:hypothetical protein